MDLTSGNVTDVFLDCLYSEKDATGQNSETSKPIPVEGIATKAVFNLEKLEKHKSNIRSMLSDLDDYFMHDKGGGYSFLAACESKNKVIWTVTHRTAEQLFMLGQAVNFVRPNRPREFWHKMPGGVPYYVVNLDGFQEFPR